MYNLVENANLVPGSKVYCDNLFTSLDLLNHMSAKGVGVIGTTRQNRLNNIPLPKKKDVAKKERGYLHACYEREDKIILV